MRHLVSRLLIATIVLLMVAIPGVFFAQDEPSISVTPDTGVVGSAVFQVNVSGLTPENDYTIEFVINGLVVFTSDDSANDDGAITFSAASTEDDEAGIYTVHVLSNDSIIASAEFELTTGDEVENEDEPEQPADTPVDAIGSLSITPASGPISTLHTIRIRDLDVDTPYTVEITASETEDVVYRRLWSTDDVGGIDIEIFAEDGDTPGQQVVRVFDNNGEVVAQGEFTIEPPPVRNATVEVTPQVAQAGREFTITVSGIAQFDSVSAQITSENSTLIDTILARASSEGVAILSFLSSDELEDGTYNISIIVDGDQLATSSLTIGDASTVETPEEVPTDAPEDADDNNEETIIETTADLSVTPEVALLGETQIVTITGLEAGQPITFTIFNRDDEVEYSTTRMADDSGEFTINISTSDDDELGSYPVEVTDPTSGKLLAQGALVIAEMQSSPDNDTGESTTTDDTQQAGSGSITVDPVTGEIGATHVITLSSMPANSRIGVTIRNASDDTLALSSVVSTDADGNGTVEFTSRDLNAAGDYTIVAVQAGVGELAQATLTIEGAIATVEPQAGVIGTAHIITVSGLNPNETVTYDVMYNGESVYTTESTADADGVSALTLTTEEGDELGDYTVMVGRESGNEPSVVLTVTEEDIATTEDETTDSEETETTDESSDEPTDETTDESTAPAMTYGESQVYEQMIPENGIAVIDVSGEEGDYVLIYVESDAFDVAASLYTDDYLEIGYNDDTSNTTNAKIGPVKLPYAGTYTLEVYPSYYYDEAITGVPFTATIIPITIPSVTYDEPMPFSLSEDTPSAYYVVPVDAGDSINILGNTSGTLDTVIRVLNSDGYEIAYDDDGGAGLEAEINNLLVDYPDEYIVEITTFTPDISGDGNLVVEYNPVKSLEDGNATITLNDKSYRDLVTFDAFAGELVTLNLETLSGSAEDLNVYASVDGMQVMSYTTMGIPKNLPLTFVMPMDGTVVVSFEEYGFGSGITLDVSVTKSRRN